MHAPGLIIKDLRLFQGLPGSAFEEIAAHCRLNVFEAGQIILAQNAPPGDFYIVCEGCVEVVLDNKGKERVSLALLGPGEYFGEMSILTGELTSAAIVAVEKCSVLVVPGEWFTRILDLVPQLNRDLVRTLSSRLRKVNIGIWEARNKELALLRLSKDEKRGKYGEIIGKSKNIKIIRESLPKWSSCDDPLYLVGEKGTGKELFARLVHEAGNRKEKPFIAVDCEKLADEIEEKIFGQFGYLELADGGTLLLKNIDLLSPPVLKRLADFLERPFVNIRLITTSREYIMQKVLQEELEAGIFKRLFANAINLPPLRDRKRDIPELIQHFLNKYAKRYNRATPDINKDAVEKLLSYEYSLGNVGELEEVLERAFLLAENDVISSEHIFWGGVVGKAGFGINLFRFRPVMSAVQKGFYPGILQYVSTFLFSVILVSSFCGTKDYNQNWPTMLAWSIGWPALIFSSAVFGRISCSICPISFIAGRVQKIMHFPRPIPGMVKKYDYFIITALFVLIFWVEEVTDMRNSPMATGLLLLSITLGAVSAAVLFPRQAWCRHLCPLGGMVGVCSMASLIELRSNAEVCLNRCTTHNCYKGSGKIEGCPLFQHVPFIDNNQVCKLCLSCVRNCPNDAIQLSIRPPAREIWGLSRVNRGMTVFVTVFLAIIFPLAIFDRLRTTLDHARWVIWFSFTYWSLALAAVFFTWLLIKDKLNDEKSLPTIRALYAIVPLALAAHLAYQIKFLPAVPDLTIKIFQHGPGAQVVEVLGVPVLDLLMLLSLLTGLLVFLVCTWKIIKNRTA